MQVKDLYKKDFLELKNKLIQLLFKQFNLRIQASRNQLKHTHLLKQLRRDIARVKTALNNVI